MNSLRGGSPMICLQRTPRFGGVSCIDMRDIAAFVSLLASAAVTGNIPGLTKSLLFAAPSHVKNDKSLSDMPAPSSDFAVIVTPLVRDHVQQLSTGSLPTWRS